MGQAITDRELRVALRLALRITKTTSEELAFTEGDSRLDSPGFRKLIEEILFSRRFIHTYHAVIGFLLLAFTAAHWGGKLIQWRKRRGAKERIRRKNTINGTDSLSKEEMVLGNEDMDGGSSSSSSTVNGTVYHPYRSKIDAEDNERTYLLQRPEDTSESTRKTSLGMKIRAWLIYQPKPIPVVNKILPSSGTTLSVLILYAINIFYTFYHVSLSIPMLFAFADRTSLLFVVNLPLLYLLAAKNQPIKALTGYSYESLNIYHRRLGEIVCLLALLHSIGMVGVWYSLLRPSGVTLGAFLLKKIILLGLGALIAYETLYFTSLGSFRQRWYELFLGLHVGLQVVALVLLWFHHHGSRIYVAIALAIFLIDRLVYRMTIKPSTFRATLAVFEDQKTVGLHISIPQSKSKSAVKEIINSDITRGWKPTYHIFLTIPSISRKHIIQAHPFTIASRAPALSAERAELKLIIRAQDGFSSDLLRYAKGHDTVPIRLDGPYGSQFAVDLLQNSDLSIVVAGGSGVAVAWPLIWSVIDTSQNDDSETALSTATGKKSLFVWIIQKASHMTWVGESQLAILRTHGADVVVPPPTFENGRPDVSQIIESWVSKHFKREHDEYNTVGVVCSGPDGMNRAVRNTCSTLLSKGVEIGIEIEKFGW